MLGPVAFLRNPVRSSSEVVICKNQTFSLENYDANFSMPFGVNAWSYPLNESFGLAEAGNRPCLLFLNAN